MLAVVLIVLALLCAALSLLLGGRLRRWAASRAAVRRLRATVPPEGQA